MPQLRRVRDQLRRRRDAEVEAVPTVRIEMH
jgi:hypothetical protein